MQVLKYPHRTSNLGNEVAMEASMGVNLFNKLNVKGAVLFVYS